MHLYIAKMEVHSPIIFTGNIVGGTKTGFIFSTPAYLHNYPLMYALMERPAEAAFVESGKTLTVKALKYKSLSEWVRMAARGDDGEWVYAYPPLPVRVKRVLIHTTMLADQYYYDVRGRLKTYAPRNQNYVAIAPGSEYCGLVISPRRLPRKAYISIGVKRLGILKLSLYEASVTGRSEGLALSTIPINEGDMDAMGVRGLSYKLLWEFPPGGPRRRVSTAMGHGLSVIEPDEDGSRLRGACRRIIAPLPPSLGVRVLSGQR